MNSEKLSSALDEIKKVFESAKRYEEVDQDDKIEPKKAWDKFISDLLGFWDGHSLLVLSLLENNPTKSHKFWGAGEADCPADIKSSNGELHTLRCKVCGKDNNQQPCTVGPAIQALTQGEAVVSADSIERLAKHLCSKKYPNQDIEFQGGNEFRLWEYHIIEAHEYLTAALQKQLR